jgi:hypothetical protein
MNREVAALFTDTSLFRSRLECAAHDVEAFAGQLNTLISEWQGDELDPALQLACYVANDCMKLAARLRAKSLEVNS